jgi:hypothetical protein
MKLVLLALFACVENAEERMQRTGTGLTQERGALGKGILTPRF